MCTVYNDSVVNILIWMNTKVQQWDVVAIAVFHQKSQVRKIIATLVRINVDRASVRVGRGCTTLRAPDRKSRHRSADYSPITFSIITPLVKVYVGVEVSSSI